MQKKKFKYIISILVILAILLIAVISFISISRIFGDPQNTQNNGTSGNSEIITYNTSGDDSANYVDGDTNGEKSHWVKNGDIWTYTFYVDDPNAQWNIWEDSETLMEGYTGDYTENNIGTLFTTVNLNEFTPNSSMSSKVDSTGKTVYTWLDSENAYKVIDNGDGTYTKVTTKLSFTITNTKQGVTVPEVQKGSLTIQKIVKNSSDEILTETDDSTNFQITVTLSEGTANSELIEGTKIFGNVVFKNKQAKVALKAGKSVTIKDLPAGVTYTVVENEYTGYETSYVDENGEIVANTEKNVVITNTKKAPPQNTTNPGPSTNPDPQDPEQKYVDITIRKAVTGNNEISEQSTIEIELNNLTKNTSYELSDGTIFSSNSEGSANVSVILENNQTVTLKNIPVGAKYKAFEYAGDYVSSYVITDSNNKGLIANTANRNAKNNTSISTATETADEDENVIITFTNKKIVTQNLKLTKTVTDEQDENDYIFDIEFGEMEEGTAFNSTAGRVIAEANGKAELSVYLANGDVVEFYEVPVGTTYRIKELASGSIASYTITDKNGLNKIEKASDSNTKAKKALSTEIETVNQGEDVTVNFINNTVNVEPDSVEVSLGITKNVQNKAGETLEDCSDTFDFELVANGNYPMPEKTSVKVSGNGTASFGTITFTETGTYVYKITEKAGNDSEYEYDKSEYIITFEVTNPEGLLEINQSVKKNGFASEAIVFTNKTDKYEPEIPDDPVDPEPEDPTEPENPKPEEPKPEDPTEPENPKPEEPKPEDPTEPENPKPEGPKPEEPKPEEPKPEEPKPEEPKPEEPKPEEQKTDEPKKEDPKPRQPEKDEGQKETNIPEKNLNEKNKVEKEVKVSDNKVPQTGQTRIIYIVLISLITISGAGIVVYYIKLKK